MAKTICPKCNGKGFISGYRRDNGKCFQCNGSGFISKGRKKDTDEKPVRGEAGKKPISNKGYKNLLLDDLLRVNYKGINNPADLKEFRSALKKHADSLGISYKYATPTHTLLRMLAEKSSE